MPHPCLNTFQQGHFASIPLALPRFFTSQFRLYKHIDIAVHHGLGVTRSEPNLSFRAERSAGEESLTPLFVIVVCNNKRCLHFGRHDKDSMFAPI